jgi:hypothetical protein
VLLPALSAQWRRALCLEVLHGGADSGGNVRFLGDLKIVKPTGREELLVIGSLKPIDWDWIANAHVPPVTVIAIRYQVTPDSRNSKKELKFRLWSRHL